MEVMLGYKQTEVGVIPLDWDVAPLGEISTCFSGGTPTTSNQTYYGGDIPWITSGDLNRVQIADVDGRITEEGLANSAAKVVDEGTLLLALYGATAGVTAVTAIRAAINQAVLAIVPKEMSAEFLFHFLQHKKAFYIATYTQGGQPNLSGEIVKSFAVACPPLAEQTSIAAALSDVDALLGGLDRLIAKKRDLKQAAMQELLTGQTRLPGFSGEWELKRLGDLGGTYGGLTGKTKADFGTGTARYVTFMNVMTNVVIDCGSFEPVRVSPGESQNLVNEGDLLFNGSSETPDEVAMCSLMAEAVPSLFLNSFCFGFRLRDQQQANGLFLAYSIRANPGRELMKSLAQGSTRYNLSKGALLEASIRLPPTDEQAVIAAVLADMDAELTALEARRAKTRDFKQAMLQELLTGKTRLVDPTRAIDAQC